VDYTILAALQANSANKMIQDAQEGFSRLTKEYHTWYFYKRLRITDNLDEVKDKKSLTFKQRK